MTLAAAVDGRPRALPAVRSHDRLGAGALVLGALGFLLVPWYGLPGGVWGFDWLGAPASAEAASGFLQTVLHGRFQLVPVGLALLLAAPFAFRRDGGPVLVAAGAAGLGWLLLQGFAVGIGGWSFAGLEDAFGPVAAQPGFGLGAAVVATAFLFLLAAGLARGGAMRGDGFVVASVLLVVALIAAFVFFPVARVLVSAALDEAGGASASALARRLTAPDIWSLACMTGGGGPCGVFWHSLLLAVITGVTTTLLGLAFALLHRRTAFPAKGLLRALAILPIITPPFVIGLGLILLFGRSGVATGLLADWFGVAPGRWLYGLPGLVIVQMLAFTPIAYLVLVGVVDGIAPSMEEAAQTLRADRWRTFRTVTWPLMRPGLANAFLIGVVESLADFGNPLVLGGNYDVLSTDIFFAIVGSQNDPGRASALALVLLALTLSAFLVQRLWLGRRSYTTLSGKGDSGLPARLPKGLQRLILAVTLPWLLFTVLLYAMILVGGFVRSLGINNSLTLRHYVTAFGVDWTERGIFFDGRAWPSFLTTLELAAIAAPLTAAVGLLAAWLLDRQRFAGRAAFEFLTMLSFAIPGTVIGVSYILAFNVPPIELTGTGLILVVCFVFRNMPVAIRAGLASMSQIDRSLDECSLTLRHGSAATLRRVVLPLLKPAIVAALVYAFVRAITSVSAVIFLVSAEYNLATSYIVGRVEVSDFGVAIAYSTVLIVTMMLAILLISLLVGERVTGRRNLIAGGTR